jgi:hypothetical protein
MFSSAVPVQPVPCIWQAFQAPCLGLMTDTIVEIEEDLSNHASVDDDEITLILQKIWDHTYGAKVTQKITADGAVFFIVSTLPSESSIPH